MFGTSEAKEVEKLPFFSYSFRRYVEDLWAEDNTRRRLMKKVFIAVMNS